MTQLSKIAETDFTQDPGWDPGTKGRKHLRGIALNAVAKGVRASDARGHSTTIGFRVQPKVLDLASAIGRFFPEPHFWRKGKISKSALYRLIFVMGMEVLLTLLEEDNLIDDKSLANLMSTLRTLENLSGIANNQELKDEIKTLSVRLLESNLSMNKKGEVAATLRGIRESLDADDQVLAAGAIVQGENIE